MSQNPKFLECVGAVASVLVVISMVATTQAKAGDGDHSVLNVQVEAAGAKERQAALEESKAAENPQPYPTPAPIQEGMASADPSEPLLPAARGVGTDSSGAQFQNLTMGATENAELNLKLLEDQVTRNRAAYEDEKKRLDIAKAGLAELKGSEEPEDEIGREIRATSISMKKEEVSSLQNLVDKMALGIRRENTMRERLGKDHTKKKELLRVSEENIRTWSTLVLGRSSVTD